jgi:hypothetical protein
MGQTGGAGSHGTELLSARPVQVCTPPQLAVLQVRVRVRRPASPQVTEQAL